MAVSPSQPISRADLARIIALQQILDAQTAAANDVGVASSNPGAGTGAAQGAQSFGDMLGIGDRNSNTDFMSGAPPGGSILGGDRASYDPGGQGFTTANASMTGPNDAVVGGHFGGRGGADREGFGENVADPALSSPTGNPPDPGYSNVSVFGRENDTTDRASQDKQAADRAALAEAAMGRGGYGIPASFAGYTAQAVPADFPAEPNEPDVALTEGLGGKSDKGYVPGTYTPNFDWTFSQPFSPTVPSFPNGVPLPTARPAMPEDQPPSMPHITVNKPSAPLPTTPVPGRPGTPGVPGESGVSTSSPGGGGFGFGGGIDMTATGGYEGSASVGNTTGAAGFTSPGGGSGFGNVGGSQGSYGSYAGSETTPSSYGGESSGGAVGGFGGGESGSSSGQGSGSDPGGSPGGVG